jgi:hypothetical protein
VIHTTTTNLNSDVVIADNEISNNICTPKGDWNYTAAQLTIIGILYKNKMYQAVNNNEEAFKQEATALLDSLPQPFYALNANMEYGNYLGYLNKKYRIEEIRPFKGAGWSKARFYQELVKMNLAPPIHDVFNDDSSRAITEWAKGNIKDVLLHNQTCLLKEHAILKHTPELLAHFKDKIKDGWYRG